jgi:hypothetical protein
MRRRAERRGVEPGFFELVRHPIDHIVYAGARDRDGEGEHDGFGRCVRRGWIVFGG